MTLKCEKEQVRVLGEYLGRLLERLAAPEGTSVGDLALVEPLTPAWAVGSIGVGYDEGADRVVLVIEEIREGDAAAEEGEESARSGGGASWRQRQRRRRSRSPSRRAKSRPPRPTEPPDASASRDLRWRRSWSGPGLSSRPGDPRAGSAADR